MRVITLITFLFLSVTYQDAKAQCACCAGAASLSSMGELYNGSLTLGKKQFAAEFFADYRVLNVDGMPAEENEVMDHGNHTHTHTGTTNDHQHEEIFLDDMMILTAGARYGVSDRFMVSAILPYTILYTEEGTDKGLADLILTGTYSILNKSGFSAAVIGGVELPTGVQQDGNYENTTVVIGSGSFDPMAGIAFARSWTRLSISGNGLYKFTTDGFDGNYYGDLSVQTLQMNYSLIGDNSCVSPDSLSGKSFRLSAGVGYFGEWLDKVVEEGVTDENSGYYLGFATLQSRISFGTWSLPITLSLPVIQDLNGNQSDTGLRFRAGLMKTF